jgi:hypothetical protein
VVVHSASFNRSFHSFRLFRPRCSKALAAVHEWEEKKKCLELCLEQRRHFSPFVASTDGLLGKEATILFEILSTLLAEKLEKPWSQVEHEHCHRQSHPSLPPPRISHSDQQNEPLPLTVGGQSRPRPLPTLAPHYPHAACAGP